MKLLVIEDEVKLAAYLRKGLTEEGYVVDVVVVRQLVAMPGEFVELCARLKQGLGLTWTFAADGPLDFNTHFHIADEVMYPERMTAMRAAQGHLVASGDQQFCWMWSNPSRAALTVRVRLGP